MQILQLNEVLLTDNRQRRTFDDRKLLELAEDIAYNGLLHAPVVRSDELGQYWLVAGERRLRAITQLHTSNIPFRYNDTLLNSGEVPVVTLGELSEIEHEEAELSENICRVDLPWPERVSAEARLHSLRTQQAAERGLTQTIKATADEIAGGVATAHVRDQLSDSIILAKHLHDPEVLKAPTPKEALKVVERKAQIAHRQHLAAVLGPTLQHTRHKLINASCFGADIPTDHFDILLTDPPYAVNAQNFGEQGSGSLREYDDDIEPDELFPRIAQLATRICKLNAHAYICLSFERFYQLLESFVDTGWLVWPRPIIWSKTIGIVPNVQYGPRYTYECILYARRGDKPLQLAGLSDVLTYTSTSSFGHPDEKPADLYAEILRRCTLPGDLVIDPFCGTGPIFVAANRLHLTAWGIELNASTYATASSRIDQK